MKISRYRLEIAMARSGMTQKQLVARSGIAAPHLQKLFAGAGVRPITVHKIAEALRCDPLDIVQPEED